MEGAAGKDEDAGFGSGSTEGAAGGGGEGA